MVEQQRVPAPRRAWGTGGTPRGTPRKPSSGASHSDGLDEIYGLPYAGEKDGSGPVSRGTSQQRQQTPLWQPPPDHLMYRHYRALQRSRQKAAEKQDSMAPRLPPIAGAR